MKNGLVSVSFRKLDICEIIKLAKENGLKYIEWGSEPHVPMGNVKLARIVKRLMHGAGLKCESYGSYYGVTYKKGQHKPIMFKRVCKTALALGAKTVRIWAGWPGCGDIDAQAEARAVIHTREIANIAKKYGLTLSFECHWGTVTEEYHRAIAFIEKVGCDNVKIYFQPNPKMSVEYDLEACRALLPYTTNVHVCNHRFIGSELVKKSLNEAKDEWAEYIRLLSEDKDRVYLLEFMPNGEPDTLPEESRALYDIISEVEQ